MNQTSGDVGVFISYSREDRFIAETLSNRLQEIGYVPWVDFEEIRGGDEWKQRIEQALMHSAALIVLLTPSSVTSNWVTYEVNRARANGCVIIPLMIRQCGIPADLETLQMIDFQHGIDHAFKDLQRALLQAVVLRGSQSLDDTASSRSEVFEAKAVPSKERTTQITPSTDLQPPEKERPRALVIEDMPNTQDILRESLEEMGLDVDVASSRNQATALIRSSNYQFITLDMQLGPEDIHGEEGVYLLDLLKRYQTGVPIIMITSLDWDKRQTREFFVMYGIKDLLDKPVKKRDLRELVEKYVTGKRAAGEDKHVTSD